MPTFPFIIQSSETLDQKSMKYVRSHVTRQSMQKRRQLSDRDSHRHAPIAARPWAARVRRSQSAASHARNPPVVVTVTVDENENENENENDDPHGDGQLSALTSQRTREVERLRPSPQLSGTAAEFCPLDIPRHKLSKLLSNYQEFNSLYHVYDNGHDPGYAPFSGYLKAVAFHNPLWLTSCSLVAFSKLDTLRAANEVEILQYKALALQHLQKAIKNADTNHDDITIMSLIAFLSFEILNAETPEDHLAVQEHFKGINVLIRMRGGEEEVVKTPIGRLMMDGLNIYYLIHAVMVNQNPPPNVDGPPMLRTNTRSFVDEPHLCFSPMLKSPPCDDMAAHELRHPQAVLPFLTDLNAAWELLYMEYHSAPDSMDYLTYSAYRKQLQMPPEPIAEMTGNTRDDLLAAKLARSCYLAGSIFYRAIVSFTPFQDPTNEADVTELHALLRTIDTTIWTLTPYLQLWIVMIGVSASMTIRQKRFFGTQISRSGVLFGARWWDTFSQVMQNFLWLQRVLRGEVFPGTHLLVDNPLVGIGPLASDPAQPAFDAASMPGVDQHREKVRRNLDPTVVEMMRPPWPRDARGSIARGQWPHPPDYQAGGV